MSLARRQIIGWRVQITLLNDLVSHNKIYGADITQQKTKQNKNTNRLEAGSGKENEELSKNTHGGKGEMKEREEEGRKKRRRLEKRGEKDERKEEMEEREEEGKKGRKKEGKEIAEKRRDG
ncbi:hypothetical protein Pmani_024580 [Petrolisthes manimaculis]|uniref:Uncharacterized protein n=1 Tax=Petrolisthes manimaculis TaxID=1843537 RepID=A0AAE1P774_9EUCA|nr:hypothetical protein Pmani_024580 [Petrolisthes manimaculis]